MLTSRIARRIDSSSQRPRRRSKSNFGSRCALKSRHANLSLNELRIATSFLANSPRQPALAYLLRSPDQRPICRTLRASTGPYQHHRNLRINSFPNPSSKSRTRAAAAPPPRAEETATSATRQHRDSPSSALRESHRQPADEPATTNSFPFR